MIFQGFFSLLMTKRCGVPADAVEAINAQARRAAKRARAIPPR
jgi:hypothetical protein